AETLASRKEENEACEAAVAQYPNPFCYTMDTSESFGLKPEGQQRDSSYQVDFNHCSCNKDEIEYLKELLSRIPAVFATHKYDLGKAKVDPIEIETTDEVPISSKYLRIPFKVREEVRRHEQEMRNCGVMIPSNTPWVSSWVIVNKKDGTKRPCIDFRALNAKTVLDPFPIPRVDTVLEKISGCHWYTSLDLCNGYLQIPMSKDASRKCGIITEDGVFQMTHMPFGLKNAPGIFMRIMKEVFEGMEDFVVVYIDDILIFTKSSNFLDHLDHIQKVLLRLEEYGFKLSPKKCFFALKKVQFLGHEIWLEGYRPSELNLVAIKEFPVPTNLKQVRSFIGMGSFFRKYIKDFAKMAEPLSRLTRSDIAFEWTQEQQDAFEAIKRALMSRPVLVNPD
ncbi:MAG TPA: reverse transcriptase domain-containing protein, partial [Puia sp.]|nr:reverse transcriptase domain-containing protein [Puia sp.]